MKVSKMVLIGSWISIFIFAWLVLLDFIKLDVVSGGFFLFFVVIAFISGGLQAPPRDPTRLN